MTVIVPTDDNPNFSSVSGLKDAISSRLDREFLNSDLNDFIYMAERELERVLTVPYREVVGSVAIAGATAYLPVDFKSLRKLTLLTEPKRNLEQVSPSVLDSNWPCATAGIPEAFAIVADQFVFAPAPDNSYTASIVYDAKIAPLSDSNATNWLLNRHPDAYFYGSLIQASDWISDANRIARYRSAFEMVVDQINEEGRRYRASTAPVRLRSPGRVV